jgi:hypothetical protein
MPVLGMGEVRLNGVRVKGLPGFMAERFISHRQLAPWYDYANKKLDKNENLASMLRHRNRELCGWIYRSATRLGQ